MIEIQNTIEPKYLILDFETSGLNRGRNRDRCMVFEIGARLLAADFAPLGDFESLIAPTEDISEDNSGAEALNMHMRNGLFADLEAATERAPGLYELADVRAAFYAWLTDKGVTETSRSIILIGNNPEFDRAFSRRLFPEMERFLHYRMIDVSTLREVAAWATKLGTERLKLAMQTDDATKHRAMADVRFCYSELRAYAWMMGAGAKALLTDLQKRGVLG